MTRISEQDDFCRKTCKQWSTNPHGELKECDFCHILRIKALGRKANPSPERTTKIVLFSEQSQVSVN